jgi:acetyl-CoA carboxylase biotin carboxyl carrier protein
MALPDLPPSDAPEGEVHYSPDLLEGGSATPVDSGSPAPVRPAAVHAPATAQPDEAIDTGLVRRLADILNDTDLSEIEVERGELKIRVARQSALAAAPQLVAAPALVAAPQASAAAPASAPAATAPAAQGETMRGDQVKSPMVGTVYLQPQPGAKRFVSAGESVTAGQTLLIVEAMKTMNPIPAPRAGVIVKVLVEDGQPVEFGEPLVVIE